MEMNLFEIIDRTKRLVRLTQTQWNHVCEHPEMMGEVEHIKETLERPDKILDGTADLTVHYYFKHYKPVGKFLLVAVKYLNGEGFVITAFYTTKLAI